MGVDLKPRLLENFKVSRTKTINNPKENVYAFFQNRIRQINCVGLTEVNQEGNHYKN